jgi:hypothetical protein
MMFKCQPHSSQDINLKDAERPMQTFQHLDVRYQWTTLASTITHSLRAIKIGSINLKLSRRNLRSIPMCTWLWPRASSDLHLDDEIMQCRFMLPSQILNIQRMQIETKLTFVGSMQVSIRSRATSLFTGRFTQ